MRTGMEIVSLAAASVCSGCVGGANLFGGQDTTSQALTTAPLGSSAEAIYLQGSMWAMLMGLSAGPGEGRSEQRGNCISRWTRFNPLMKLDFSFSMVETTGGQDQAVHDQAVDGA